MPPESVPPSVPEMYFVRRCPECKGQVVDGAVAHFTGCANFARMFAVETIEVRPVAPVSSGVDEGGEVCKKCGQFVATTCPSWWSAPDALWNEVEGGPGGIRCIRCFTEDCEAKGIWVYWQAVVDGRAASVQPEANSPGEKRNDELVEADTLLGGDSRQLGVEGGRHA